MAQIDETDTWMNPPERANSWTTQRQRYPRFLIERCRKLDYVPFTEWALWKSFETREERDTELDKLREEHPVWLLRDRNELFPPLAFP